MSDIDNAANAFSAAMTTETRVDRSPKTAPPPSDSMFRNGTLDDDSDETAGGDEPLTEEEVVETEEDPDADQQPEGDEEDPDADPEEGDEEDPDAEPEDGDLNLKQEVEVTVDGKPQKVTLGEALNGYIRQETFHQRLNQLNNIETTLREQATEVVKDRERYIAMIDELDGFLKTMVAEPDWDKLYNEDPKGARELQKRHDQFKNQRAALTAEKQRVEREAQEKSVRDTQVYAQNELRTFVGLNPQWKKPEDMQKELASMHRTATGAGFSQEEVANVLDHRMLVILQKAANYDRIKAAKPKPVAVRTGKSQVAPGAGSRKTAPKEMARAQKALSRTGSVDDASKVFARILQRG